MKTKQDQNQNKTKETSIQVWSTQLMDSALAEKKIKVPFFAKEWMC